VLDDRDRSDVHKSTHALAAVDAGTGQLLGEREISATEQGHLEALRWAHEFGDETVWAVEDCRNLSHHLEQALIGAGERVVRVPPKLMGASRRGEREPGKSDQIEARAIARAVLRDGVERFPQAFLDPAAAEIRLLCDHRESLVVEKTRLTNRLRINLLVLDPVLEGKVPSRKLDYPGQLRRISGRLRSMPQTARVRIAREQVKRIATLTREAEALKRELRDLIRQHQPELLAETGCGPLCAAILIGQAAGAARFASDAQFARAAGVAPIPVSAGRQHRHRLDRGGNRQLNRALHIIAITRGRIDPATRAYLARKEAEGKSRTEAMCCLTRHLARHFYRQLATPGPHPNAAPGAPRRCVTSPPQTSHVPPSAKAKGRRSRPTPHPRGHDHGHPDPPTPNSANTAVALT
jgi:transposase